MTNADEETMDTTGLVWWTGHELKVTDGAKVLTILMGTTHAVDVARMLYFAADALAQDPVHADAVRAKCDAFNEWVEAAVPTPRGRDAIRVVPDAP